jgi:hypothetical protein
MICKIHQYLYIYTLIYASTSKLFKDPKDVSHILLDPVAVSIFPYVSYVTYVSLIKINYLFQYNNIHVQE